MVKSKLTSCSKKLLITLFFSELRSSFYRNSSIFMDQIPIKILYSNI
ncbi:hypothetical protein MTR67_010736 [Solanum verrucosum]|uniref:Uncharacterized protein n=1 Tax=Solanum verrucosum TaxID=315347 RepID=A0AAF0QBB7_SOLVR|nr:hypothetical protein MTR67_010736 [Solanum verrucosum]